MVVNKAIFQSKLAMFGIMYDLRVIVAVVVIYQLDIQTCTAQFRISSFCITSDHLSILTVSTANPHVKCGLCILLI